MGLRIFFQKAVNRFLMRWGAVNRIRVSEPVVFLTFDDGPEPGITEFVLEELDKYGFKATFFCKGECAEKNPELLRLIKSKGHAVGNHTYEHIHAYDRDVKSYVRDVERADNVLHTHFFRPPNGCLKLFSWLRLRNKYKIIYWTIGSGDWQKETFGYEHNMFRLKQTGKGDIILFHFCEELQNGTRQLLPKYLSWLDEQGFVSKTLE